MPLPNSPGHEKEIRLKQGTIRYRECGSGTPIVFVHGVLVNGHLRRKVILPLAKDFRCIAPDWPLGSHGLAMNPGADRSPPGLAKLIAHFLAEMNLEEVTLVGNNTGGALCQLVITDFPDRIAHLVLTNCDAFDNFLPLLFRYLQWGAHIPGFVFLIGQALRFQAVRRLPFAYRWLAKRPIEPEALASYVNPVASNKAVRHDLTKVLQGISPKVTLAVANKLAGFKKPVLIAWASDDRFFPFEHARKLSACFPNARLESIQDSYTFFPEDQPQRLAGLISAFVREHRKGGHSC